jgi:hypothetical protein
MTKAQRLAARMIPWDGSPTNEGRTRLRGGKKGAPSLLAQDLFDVRAAFREIESALAMLEAVNAGDGASDIDRRERHREARGKIALAGRFVDEVVIRRDPGKTPKRGDTGAEAAHVATCLMCGR